jgi:hypothetical protein
MSKIHLMFASDTHDAAILANIVEDEGATVISITHVPHRSMYSVFFRAPEDFRMYQVEDIWAKHHADRNVAMQDFLSTKQEIMAEMLNEEKKLK